MESSLYYELFEIMEKQGQVILKQNELIARLANDNLEKENMMNVLIKKPNGI